MNEELARPHDVIQWVLKREHQEPPSAVVRMVAARIAESQTLIDNVPKKRMMRCRAMLKSFAEQVVIAPSGCWDWNGNLDHNGYGRLSFGHHNRHASRLSFLITKGAIADDMVVCHHCDNPKCTNPEHLYLGTHKSNYADMVSRGRAAWQKTA